MAMTTINNLDSFIQSKPTSFIDYQSESFVEERGWIQLPIQNIFTVDYFPELLALSKRVVLSADEIVKYRYKPKLLSYDIYNTTELYYLILRLNNLYNIKDFTIAKGYLNLVPSETLAEALTIINRNEKQNISKYNSRHKLKDR